MAQHALIDAAGKLKGFFDDRLHKQLPAGVVTLTPAQYAQWLNGQNSLVWDTATGTLVAAPARAPVAAPVPKAVTAFQLKAALLAMPGAQAGKTLLDDVNTWAAGASSLLYLTWTEAATIARNGSFVTQAAAKFGWTSEQLDAMFIAAAAIQA